MPCYGQSHQDWTPLGPSYGGKVKRIYIAGPCTGYPDKNYPAFHAAAAFLRAAGFEVENPAENPAPACGSWLGYMRMAVAQIARVDALVLLPGWERSQGAQVEFRLAEGLGLKVMTLEKFRAQHVEHHPV